MRIQQMIIAATVAAAAGGLIVPALAQVTDSPGAATGQGMMMGRPAPGMMGHGMMRGGMMSGGCGGMMRSMTGGDGRPNSQWQTHRPDNAAPN